jgi:hypothetical protein
MTRGLFRSNSLVQRILALLVESGAIYFVLWVRLFTMMCSKSGQAQTRSAGGLDSGALVSFFRFKWPDICKCAAGNLWSDSGKSMLAIFMPLS